MFYYRMNNEPDSVFITEEPQEIENTTEITEEEYNDMLRERAERNLDDSGSVLDIAAASPYALD